MSDRDTHFMALALHQAQAAGAAGEAPIGAIIVDPGTDKVVSSGFNLSISTHDPTAHAEIVALRKAAKTRENYRLTGLEMFVTLEPCVMCTGAISHARLGRLIFGAEDVKGGAVVNGPRFFEQPTCHWRPEILSGVMAEPCGQILKDFFRARRSK